MRFNWMYRLVIQINIINVEKVTYLKNLRKNMNVLFEEFTFSPLGLKILTNNETSIVVINDIYLTITSCDKRGAIINNSDHLGTGSNVLSFADTFSDTYRKASKALCNTSYLSSNLPSNNTLRTNLIASVIMHLMTSGSDTTVNDELVLSIIKEFISLISPPEILSQLAKSEAVEEPLLFANYFYNLKVSIESSLCRELYEEETKKVIAFAADYLSSKKCYSEDIFEDCFNLIDSNQDKFALCE